MSPAECLETLRRFESWSRDPGGRATFVDSLVSLFDWAENPPAKMRRCTVCHGWGIVKRGPCPVCGSLGFIALRRGRQEW